MKTLEPLVDLIAKPEGNPIDLPEPLAQFYGPLWFPAHAGRPYVITNFVESMDGIVSLSVPGHDGGGEISGFYAPDQAVMGLLRACADAVIVGTSQLRRPPGTIWLPDSIYPDFAQAYQHLRRQLGKSAPPVQVVVTGTGEIDLNLPIFQEEQAEVVILTTQIGKIVLQQQSPPAHLGILAVTETARIPAALIIETINHLIPEGLLLIEGGPHLVRYFLEEQLLNELFLTLAPQIAGRDMTLLRPGFTIGKNFAPEDPRWCRLVGLKQSQDYLFLRYRIR